MTDKMVTFRYVHIYGTPLYHRTI